MILYVDCKCRMAQASDCGHCKGTGSYPASTTELLAAVRRGVESGTIKGEVVWWCETHGEVNVEQWCPGGPVAAALNQFDDVAEMPPCRFVFSLVIPGSDGGDG